MWQKIKDAPRDGTVVLGAQIKGGEYTMQPIALYHGTYHPNAPGKPCWRDSYNRHITWPTHFQPLPPADAPETVELDAAKCKKPAVDLWARMQFANDWKAVTDGVELFLAWARSGE